MPSREPILARTQGIAVGEHTLCCRHLGESDSGRRLLNPASGRNMLDKLLAAVLATLSLPTAKMLHNQPLWVQ